MELNKIENGNLVQAPINGTWNGRLVSNLNTEMKIDLGFKETFWFPEPDELTENQYLIEKPFEYDNKIIVDYEIINIGGV